MKLIKLEKYICRNCDTLSLLLDARVYPIKYEKVNIEENPEVAAKYGVMTVPVLLAVDEKGSEVGRITGYSPDRADEVEAFVKKHS